MKTNQFMVTQNLPLYVALNAAMLTIFFWTNDISQEMMKMCVIFSTNEQTSLN